MIGTIVGNYRIMRQLGTGGMGAVYEGMDIMVERPVAIKMLRAEIARQPELIDRFRVEAVTLARLNHPCIATLYSFFREGENYYMVMEFVRGDTLENMIHNSGRLTPEYTAEILIQTLDGMAHAQAMAVLHRDIKPANIMITNEGRVKVTDFGIARVLGSSRMTREGRIIGTLEYLAPERIRGEDADIRSDLYSVGIVMYEAVAGRLPFTADTDYSLMQAHLNETPPPLLSLGLNCPPWVETVLRKALAKTRERRYQSAEEFRDALSAAIQHPVGQAANPLAASPPGFKPTRLAVPSMVVPELPAQPSVSPRIPSRKRLPPQTIALFAGALVLLVFLLAVIYRYYPRQSESQEVAATQLPAEPAVQPPSAIDPQKAAAPVDSGRVLPLEMFQRALPSDKPREPIGISPKERDIKGGIPKDVESPGKIPKPETPPAIVAPGPGATPVDTTVNEPVQTAEPIPAKKAEASVPVRVSGGARTLQEVRKIYIEKMPNLLDEYIRTEIIEQLGDQVTVVTHREEADAILRGNLENRADKRSKVTGGYLGLKDENIGSATLTNLNGTLVLWSGEAGDKSPIMGIVKRGGPKKVAERLVKNLKETMGY